MTILSVYKQKCSLLLNTLILLVISVSSQAAIIEGSSSSYGALIDLTINPLLLPPINISTNEISSASGTAPAPYANTETALALSISQPGLLSIGLGILEADIFSDIDGNIGDKTALGSAAVDSVGIDLSLGLGLLKLGTDEITSSVGITGDYGALTFTANSSLAGAGITLLNIPITLDITPAPNTVVDLLGILNLTGITLTLNEQIVTGDGQNDRAVEVNAIHLAFNNFLLGLGLLNGDIIISHSEALIVAEADPTPDPKTVPEPGILSMIALAFLLMWRLRNPSTLNAKITL